MVVITCDRFKPFLLDALDRVARLFSRPAPLRGLGRRLVCRSRTGRLLSVERQDRSQAGRRERNGCLQESRHGCGSPRGRERIVRLTDRRLNGRGAARAGKVPRLKGDIVCGACQRVTPPGDRSRGSRSPIAIRLTRPRRECHRRTACDFRNKGDRKLRAATSFIALKRQIERTWPKLSCGRGRNPDWGVAAVDKSRRQLSMAHWPRLERCVIKLYLQRLTRHPIGDGT